MNEVYVFRIGPLTFMLNVQESSMGYSYPRVFVRFPDNSYLNFRSKTEEGWGYCVFGEVVDGKDVVDAIEAVKTGRSGMYSDVPTETIIINGVDVE